VIFNSCNSGELEWLSRSFTYCKPLQMRAFHTVVPQLTRSDRESRAVPIRQLLFLYPVHSVSCRTVCAVLLMAVDYCNDANMPYFLEGKSRPLLVHGLYSIPTCIQSPACISSYIFIIESYTKYRDGQVTFTQSQDMKQKWLKTSTKTTWYREPKHIKT